MTVSPIELAEPLEFRPDDKGEFDELVARFANGGVFIETMSDQGVYVDFSWDDGRHCQLWITVNGRSKLRYSHEDSVGDPPRFGAWGKPNARVKPRSQVMPNDPDLTPCPRCGSGAFLTLD